MLPMSDDCIFCQIVSGESPSFPVWEDEKHVAFLSIFPNTEGTTVVIPKAHHSSYAFDLADEALTDLVLAAKTVGKMIDAAFDDVGRTGMVFEGFGVNHVHAKLFPMHGTNDPEWKPRKSGINTYFATYEGFISTHDADRADDEALKKTAEKIRGAGGN